MIYFLFFSFLRGMIYFLKPWMHKVTHEAIVLKLYVDKMPNTTLIFFVLMVNVSHVTSTNAVFISHYTPTK